MGIFQDLIAYFALKEDPHDPGLPFVDLADLKILSAPNPEDFYPVYSKHAGESGAVRLLLRVDPTGRVAQVKMLGSSSFARFNQAGASLSAQFLFEPYRYQDQASTFQTSVEVEFKR
jgi:TonB family protein